MKNRYTLIMFILIVSFKLTAQSEFCSFGGQITDVGGSLSNTGGQMLYETFTSNSGTLSHGMQQPKELSIIAGIESINLNKPAIEIFPNPASDIVQIKIKASIQYLSGLKLTAKLIDFHGTSIREIEIKNQLEELNISDLPAGVYILHFTSISTASFKVTRLSYPIIKK